MYMQSSKQNSLNRRFSHVYVEEDVLMHQVTGRILEKLKRSGEVSVIPIRHYKDVFCRPNQDTVRQRSSRQLIIARKKEPLIYKGSDMCDSLGYSNFHYCINAMNCPYDCEYCYLRGAYPSANIVVFVNQDEIFNATDKLLEKGPVYMCNSYETDLPALEEFTGFTEQWIGYASSRKDLTLEIRTKSTCLSYIIDRNPSGNIILAWSVSPEETARRHEKYAPPPKARLKAMKTAMDAGWKVRLCIDPMIWSENWEAEYESLAYLIRNEIMVPDLNDISIGVFRVPSDSLRIMRKTEPGSVIAAYPYMSTGRKGICTYPRETEQEMIRFMWEKLGQ